MSLASKEIYIIYILCRVLLTGMNDNKLIYKGYHICIIIYIIKQDIRIYVPYSRPNGWTD